MNRVIIALIAGDHNYRSTRHFYLENGQRTIAVKSYWNQRHSLSFIRLRRLPSVFRDGRNNLLNCRRLLIIPPRLNPDLEPGGSTEWRGSIISPLHLTITANKYRWNGFELSTRRGETSCDKPYESASIRDSRK